MAAANRQARSRCSKRTAPCVCGPQASRAAAAVASFSAAACATGSIGGVGDLSVPSCVLASFANFAAAYASRREVASAAAIAPEESPGTKP